MYGALAAVTLAASVVNGAIGYGFSSITVPLALLFLTNRVLNPALVPVEVALNACVLWVNRAEAPAVVPRVLPIVIGLAPGIITGTLIVSRVHTDWVKLGTFTMLLPLILLQAAGFTRPLRPRPAGGLALGGAVGVLYSVTTVSGPPLALLFRSQGLARGEFRAAMGLVRLAESTMTAAAYAYAGLYTRESLLLIPAIVPSVVLGVPLGAWLIRRLDAEAFRRVCMSVDGWTVAFGIAVVLHALEFAPAVPAFGAAGVLVAADIALLYRFFSSGRKLVQPPGGLPDW